MTDTEGTAPAPAPKAKLPDIVASGGPVLPIIPRSIVESMRWANMMIKARIVPDSLGKDPATKREYPPDELVSRVLAVILKGSEVGLPPMQAVATIALINKRAVVWGEGAIALLHSSGQLEEMIEEEVGVVPDNSMPTAQFAPDYGKRIILKRKGNPTPFVGTYTVGQAKRAHQWMNNNKSTWIEYPERMLFWKAFHLAASAGFADCLAGLAIRELVDERPVAPRLTDTSFLDAGPLKPPPVREPDDGDPDAGEVEEEDPEEGEHHDDDA